MEVRWTCDTSPEVGSLLGRATIELQEALTPLFRERSYGGGVDQLVVMVVSVDSDPSENIKICERHNKVGSYKHPITSERVKYIGLALSFDPASIEGETDDQVRRLLCTALIGRLQEPGLKIPKAFDYERFSDDVSSALEIYSRASFTG